MYCKQGTQLILQIVIKFEEFFLFSNCYYVSPDLFFQICQRSSLGVIYGDSALCTLISMGLYYQIISLYKCLQNAGSRQKKHLLEGNPQTTLSHFLLTLSLPDSWAGDNTDLPSDSNILKMVRVNIGLQERFLKNIQ